jgi:hypothetical protein
VLDGTLHRFHRLSPEVGLTGADADADTEADAGPLV